MVTEFWTEAEGARQLLAIVLVLVLVLEESPHGEARHTSQVVVSSDTDTSSIVTSHLDDAIIHEQVLER